MSLELNRRAKNVKVPGTRQLSNLLANDIDAVNLTIGQPDFPTPERVQQAGIRAIQENKTSYSHNFGIIEARRAIASFFQDKYNVEYDPETEILITSGSSEGLDSVFRTILDEGDEVVIPAPAYMNYQAPIELNGAKAVFFDTSDTGFLPTAEKLEEMINENTKAVLFNYPTNPTGVTIPKEVMDELVEVLVKHDVYIVSDEIYSENVFGMEHHTFAAYPEIRDRLFLIHGLSKSHSMTGWRIGYVLAPAELLAYVSRIHAYNCVCANIPGQYAAVEALTNCREASEEMNKEYIKRRDFLYKALTEMGIESVLPNGAFYIFPSIKKFGMSSQEFTMRLLEEGGVAVLPGNNFTEYGEGFIRISYSYAMPELEKGMEKLKAFVEKLEKEASVEV